MFSAEIQGRTPGKQSDQERWNVKRLPFWKGSLRSLMIICFWVIQIGTVVQILIRAGIGQNGVNKRVGNLSLGVGQNGSAWESCPWEVSVVIWVVCRVVNKPGLSGISAQ